MVRLGAMGDILHALPAVTALRQAHPSWHIGWVVEPRWQALLRAGTEGPREQGNERSFAARFCRAIQPAEIISVGELCNKGTTFSRADKASKINGGF